MTTTKTAKKAEIKKEDPSLTPLLAQSGAEFHKLLLAIADILYSRIECAVLSEQVLNVLEKTQEDGFASDMVEEAMEEFKENGGSIEEIKEHASFSKCMDMIQTAVVLACYEYRALAEGKKMKKFLPMASDSVSAKSLLDAYNKRMSEVSQKMVEAGSEMEEMPDGRMIPKEFRKWDYDGKGSEFITDSFHEEDKIVDKSKKGLDDFLSLAKDKDE